MPAPRVRYPGVVDVVQFTGDAGRPGGVAVLAANTWIAQRGRDALQIQWDESGASHTDSGQLMERLRGLARAAFDAGSTPVEARVALRTGDDSVLQAADALRLEALYEVPYLAHAAMEPMNCLVQLTDGGVSLWNGEQLQSVDQAAVGALLGIAQEKVSITQLYAGRQLRSARKSPRRLRARGGRRRAGGRDTGTPHTDQARLDTRGRHARGLLSPRFRARNPCGARCER